jgi:hypothetical protein
LGKNFESLSEWVLFREEAGIVSVIVSHAGQEKIN